MSNVVWAPIAVGLVLLAFGRKLYWLFVGCIGFGAGLLVASRVTGREPDGTALLVALLAGVVGIVFALLVQRIAVALAGFLAGAWLGIGLWEALAHGGHAPGAVPWIPALVGGVLGAAISSTLFSWLLILVSSVAGAALVAQYLPISRSSQGVALAVLAVLGMVFQGGLARRSAPPLERETR